MQKAALLINVARGGVVNEVALAAALQDGTIAGVGVDVFEIEPATTTSGPLTSGKIPNLVLSPHIGWYGSSSVENIRSTLRVNVEQFVAGKPQNVII